MRMIYCLLLSILVCSTFYQVTSPTLDKVLLISLFLLGVSQFWMVLNILTNQVMIIWNFMFPQRLMIHKGWLQWVFLFLYQPVSSNRGQSHLGTFCQQLSDLNAITQSVRAMMCLNIFWCVLFIFKHLPIVLNKCD